MGEKSCEKVTVEMKSERGVDLIWLRNIVWCGCVFAKEMSSIKGVECSLPTRPAAAGGGE